MAAEIKIGYLTTLYHTSFILRASGRMDELDIKASWKLFPNGPAMVEAFEKEELDLGYIGLPPAMIGIARGLKIAGGHVEGTVLICQHPVSFISFRVFMPDRMLNKPF